MSALSQYHARMSSAGETRRDARIHRTQDTIIRRIFSSPSSHSVLINGHEQTIAVRHQSEMHIKRICALPGEHLVHGGLVEFADNVWLITEVDVDNEVYERGLMQRCNHKLKWINRRGDLIEKWCIVEDGTKYLIGEKVNQLMSIGDARIAVTIGKDEDTDELDRGMRFLIDDPDSPHPLAYQITKPNRFFNLYNGKGIYRYILNEVNLTADDDTELRIADFLNWKPDKELDGDHRNSDKTVEEVVNDAYDKAEIVPGDFKEEWI